jgi:hypothetical protein
MYYSTWGQVLMNSFSTMWASVIAFLPNVFAALVIFIVGWIVAVGLAKLVMRGVRMTRVDVLLERMGFREPVERAGYKLDAGKFMGELVKWFVIIAFLVAITDILNLGEVSTFLKDIVYYMPSIIIAAVIMLAAVMIASFVQKIVQASTSLGRLNSGKFLSALAKWSILIFAFLTALIQLGVAPTLINTFFMGIVAMVAIAGGLAFGLGGKDMAAQLLDKLKREVTEHHE